jgi:hypothetical protein
VFCRWEHTEAIVLNCNLEDSSALSHILRRWGGGEGGDCLAFSHQHYSRSGSGIQCFFDPPSPTDPGSNPYFLELSNNFFIFELKILKFFVNRLKFYLPTVPVQKKLCEIYGYKNSLQLKKLSDNLLFIFFRDPRSGILDPVSEIRDPI